MADTSSSDTASWTAEIDADTIRQSYEAGLSAWGALPSPAERVRLSGLLRGHIQLLVPEVDDCAPRMQGEQQRSTALYVVARARRLLTDAAGIQPRIDASHVHDLATQCRALLTLHQHPGPLTEPEVDVTGGQR